mmetsp:Transcript_46636/g.141299  ORF Transcript_46636/g.141299 Transcript_46636/m.141299 type:complete len:241 (+) Transcript_46636:327-1049(+)
MIPVRATATTVTVTIVITVLPVTGRRAATTVTVSSRAARPRPAPPATAITPPVSARTAVSATIIIVTIISATVTTTAIIIVIAPTISTTIVATSTICWGTVALPVTISSLPASISITHPAGNKLNSNDTLVQLSSIGCFFRPLRILNIGKLNECVIALHVNAHNLSERREQHLKIFALGGLLVEIDNEECLRGQNPLAPIILFAFDAPVTTSELGAELLGDTWNLPVDRSGACCVRREKT